MSAAEKIISLSSRRVAAEGKSRMQEGFVAVPNEMFDALLSADLTGRQLKVALAIVRKTLGFGKTEDDMTITQIAELARIHRPDASKAFQQLLDFKVIAARKGRHGQIISVNHSSVWDFQPSQNATEGTTNVAKRYVQPSQNATHNRQLQQTEEKTMSPAQAEDVKAPKARKQSAPVADLIKLYNQTLGNRLPEVQVASDARKRQLSARWNEMLGSVRPDGKIRYQGSEDGLKWWGAFFAKVATNPHWMGDNDRGWTADFDWIIKPANFAKILEYRPAKKGGR